MCSLKYFDISLYAGLHSNFATNCSLCQHNQCVTIPVAKVVAIREANFQISNYAPLRLNPRMAPGHCIEQCMSLVEKTNLSRINVIKG